MTVGYCMTEQRVVGIHQPNFFPWLGFFDKVSRSDIFILLDHVQIPKTGGSAVNHVKVLFTDGEARWITAPIRRYHGVRTINNVKINHDTNWRKFFLKTLWANYSRAEYYDQVYSFLEPIIMNNNENLSEYNLYAITKFVEKLGLKTKLIRSSWMLYEGTSNEMLISLVKNVDGNVYLSGNGATYMIDSMYEREHIAVVCQNFEHPTYPQLKNKPFVKGLSVIDAMMHVGFGGVRDLLSPDLY